MKNLWVLTAAIALSISASNSFAMGRKLPKQPVAEPTAKHYPSGKTFAESGSSLDPQFAEGVAQSDADQDCASGKALRIGAWQVGEQGSYQFPGDCETTNGVETCADPTEVTFYSAGARFQCK